MFGRQALVCVGIVLLSFLLIGCGMRPQIDFYLEPIATSEQQRINREAGSVTMEDEYVSITISAVDTVDLLEVTSDPYINPYIYVGDWGIVVPRYTIFDVSVKNVSDSEFSLELSNAMLMDEEGEQYEVIPYEAFRERYGVYPQLEREIVYYSPSYYSRRRWGHPWYYHYDRYSDYRPYYVRRIYSVSYLKSAVVKGTMYRPVRLYPGGKRQGFLVFPLVSPDTAELKIIIPDVLKQGRKLEFHFGRIPAGKAE